jgi:hypothetical protein
LSYAGYYYSGFSHIGDRGARALAASEQLVALNFLCLGRSPHIGPQARETLCRRFPQVEMS